MNQSAEGIDMGKERDEAEDPITWYWDVVHGERVKVNVYMPRAGADSSGNGVQVTVYPTSIHGRTMLGAG